ncbi:MAG: hypothetical protein JSS75_09655 [Bacteroidetes bacterium]|nr:hypothetical protein [Bacteroidota bacterium]
MTQQPLSNGVTVKTSVTARKENKRTLTILMLVIGLILAIAVTYIIIYPSL